MPLSKIDTRSVLFSTIAHRGPEMMPEPKPRVTPRRKYSKSHDPVAKACHSASRGG